MPKENTEGLYIFKALGELMRPKPATIGLSSHNCWIGEWGYCQYCLWTPISLSIILRRVQSSVIQILVISIIRQGLLFRRILSSYSAHSATSGSAKQYNRPSTTSLGWLLLTYSLGSQVNHFTMLFEEHQLPHIIRSIHSQTLNLHQMS